MSFCVIHTESVCLLSIHLLSLSILSLFFPFFFLTGIAYEYPAISIK